MTEPALGVLARFGGNVPSPSRRWMALGRVSLHARTVLWTPRPFLAPTAASMDSASESDDVRNRRRLTPRTALAPCKAVASSCPPSEVTDVFVDAPLAAAPGRSASKPSRDARTALAFNARRRSRGECTLHYLASTFIAASSPGCCHALGGCHEYTMVPMSRDFRCDREFGPVLVTDTLQFLKVIVQPRLWIQRPACQLLDSIAACNSEQLVASGPSNTRTRR
ncbi:hypothetical protein PLICRDRAFT_354375 [Plicaturopsis crispa FD-325 SS-3]|uniref:Uncharacterized protein n=1 Tax=Plicaturopsis crispa FD-325 SS-3 TaxID=944288 RepID=A0A0C9T5J4_PLICR|nr:hypothetical protein PLICRDRAFT_354375 [Plicaturopsis crispa FD-325 SS-3]